MNFVLPAMRMPQRAAEAMTETLARPINDSLYDYLRRLPAQASQYETLAAKAETAAFYLWVEVLHQCALPETALNVAGTAGRAALARLRGRDAFVEADADLLLSGEEAALGAMGGLRAGGTAVVLVQDLTCRAAVQLAYLMAALFGKVAVYTPSLYAGDQKFLIGADYKGGAEAAPREFAMSIYFLTRLEEINTVVGQAQMDFMRADLKMETFSDWRATYFNLLSA